MKKALRIILIVLLALAVLATAFILLYRHFVANQIMDRGGMENPFLESAYDEQTQAPAQAAVEQAGTSGARSEERDEK